MIRVKACVCGGRWVGDGVLRNGKNLCLHSVLKTFSALKRCEVVKSCKLCATLPKALS